MQRFRAGDPILVLPRFAQLYPGSSAVVVGVTLNRFRPMFNDYTVRFPDGSTDNLFEFQILEDGLKYQTFTATLIFDSFQQQPASQLRGPASDRQILLQTADIDVDLKIHQIGFRAAITGQVLARDPSVVVTDAEVTLMQDSNPIDVTKIDGVGAFRFNSVPAGNLNIQVVIPKTAHRVLGMFSI